MQLKLGNANEMVYPSSSSNEKLGERNNVSSANGSISGADEKSYHTAYSSMIELKDFTQKDQEQRGLRASVQPSSSFTS